MKYLAVDFGLRRVGFAISDGELASPFKVIKGSSYSDFLEIIKKESSNFDKIIIGLPEGKMGKIVKKIIRALQTAGLDAVATDETLSTKEATKQMIELSIPKQKRRENDAYSAAIILQNYLDEKN